MFLNIEQSAELDKEYSEEKLVNMGPGLLSCLKACRMSEKFGVSILQWRPFFTPGIIFELMSHDFEADFCVATTGAFLGC